MASPDLTLPRPRVGVADRARSAASRVTARPELLALIALAAVLNLWALDRNGDANEYYSAAVRSMADNWHAFLFASFDSSGVMTVDKPPLAFWIQALSARAFGFGSWSILVPQALMGVASVALTYDLTRRVFGRWAGTAAGLALALTPIAAAISRHNNPDALLVLCSVGALWALVRGLEDGRTRWLLLSGALIGLGFETKMAAALTIVPGIVLAWLWIAPRGRRAAIGQLAGFSGVAAAVGLAWPVLVWLTPAANRPWVSGTSDNSIWSLIFGYNGLGRLFGQSGGPGGAATGGPGGGGGGGMGGVFGGETGPFRLLNSALGGQAGWLLGAAVVVAIALLVLTRLRRDDPRSGWLIAIGGAWLVTAVAFSRAEGIFHPYYVSLLAPFTAALVGAGVGVVVRGGVPARVVGPLMIAGGIVTSLVVIDRSATDMAWLRLLLIGGGVIVAIVLALGLPRRIRQTAIAAAIGLLLFAPASWAVDTLGYATSSTFPAGGPSRAGMGGPGGGGMGPGGGGRFGGQGGQVGPPSGGMNGGVPPGAAGGAAGSSGGGSGSSSSSDGAGLPPGTTVDPSSGSGSSGSGSSGSGTSSRNARGGMGGPGGGGGLGGGNTQTLTSALAYAKQHGGGVVAVSSQNGAASQLLTRDPTAQVAAIGGFSGRESQVTVAWLADAVESGRIRWVLSDGSSGGMRGDDRVGASDVMSLTAQVGKAVSSVDGLYDLQGMADALRAAG